MLFIFALWLFDAWMFSAGAVCHAPQPYEVAGYELREATVWETGIPGIVWVTVYQGGQMWALDRISDPPAGAAVLLEALPVEVSTPALPRCDLWLRYNGDVL